MSADRTASDNAVAPPRSWARRSAPRSSSRRRSAEVRGIRRGDQKHGAFGLGFRVHGGAVIEQRADLLDVGHGPDERGRASRTFGVRIGVMRKQDLHDACVAEQGRRHHGRYAVGVHGVRVRAAFERSLDLAGGASPNGREQRIRRTAASERTRPRPAAPPHSRRWNFMPGILAPAGPSGHEILSRAQGRPGLSLSKAKVC